MTLDVHNSYSNAITHPLRSAGVIGGEDEPIESRQFNENTNSAGIFSGTGGKRRNESQYPAQKSPQMVYGK